jgi:catechol 2,3-dioxygenase-like lactoylglutathione lyase family enzyme
MIALSTPQPARHPSPVTKATGLAYLAFERPDLERAHAFLVDFGLKPVEQRDNALFLRAASTAPYVYRVERAKAPRFAALAFDVADRSALEALAVLPGASSVEVEDGPGGGERVRLFDPSGFEVRAIWGRRECAPAPYRKPLVLNAPDAHARINGVQRPDVAAPDVVRLGHVVLECADYQATSAWYTHTFGLIPSDVQVLPDGSPAVTFFRLDLGSRPTDHHTLALAQGIAPVYSHSAYEVVDADAVGMGQRVLRERGYRHAWGIGRHILGSQIFDYWVDPFGDKHEHYCDGDLLTADQPMGVERVSRKAMSQWGQVMPADFTKPKLSARSLLEIPKNVYRSPDLSLGKLRALAKIFG